MAEAAHLNGPEASGGEEEPMTSSRARTPGASHLPVPATSKLHRRLESKPLAGGPGEQVVKRVRHSSL